MESDSQLMQAFVRSRNEQAFRALVDRHTDWCYSVALRMVGRDAHLAEEVCMTVFTRLAENASQLCDRDSIGGWLYVSLKYIARDRLRSEARRKRNEETYAMQKEDEQEPINWEEAHSVLRDVVGELKDADRDAVCLRFFEGLSFNEIGQRLGVKENTARMRLNRAIERLQGLLVKRGIRTSVGALGVGLGTQASSAAPVGLALNLANGALAATATGVSSSALAAFLVFMKTKTITVSAVAAALLAGGVATSQWNKAAKLRSELEIVVLEHKTQAERIQTMEIALEDALSAARTPSVAALSSPEPLAVEEEIPVARPREELTRAFVMEEVKRARVLMRQGDYSEAAKLLFWALDTGTSEVESLKGVQPFLVDFLSSIAQEDASVRYELSLRRDAMERGLIASEGGDRPSYNDLKVWHKMNQSLEEGNRSLEFFDKIEDPITERIAQRVVTDELVEAQRYEDATRPGMGAQTFSSFEQMLQSAADSSEGRPGLVKDSVHQTARESMGVNLEALAGAGKSEEALDLIENVLSVDSSPETLDVIGGHLQRAGATWLLEHLEQQGGG